MPFLKGKKEQFHSSNYICVGLIRVMGGRRIYQRKVVFSISIRYLKVRIGKPSKTDSLSLKKKKAIAKSNVVSIFI